MQKNADARESGCAIWHTTAIPRQTVRRKLDRLAVAGWVREVEAGWDIGVRSIDPDLRGFTRERTRRLLAAAADVGGELEDAAHALQRAPAPPVTRRAALVPAAGKRPARDDRTVVDTQGA